MSALKTLFESRTAAVKELDEFMDTLKDSESGEVREQLTTEEETRSQSLLSAVDEIDERIEQEERKAKRADVIAEARKRVSHVDVDVEVVDEPMVYGEGSPNSYYADLISVQAGPQFGKNDPGATERMAKWAHQVERELANNSDFGKTAETQLREHSRTENGMESRKQLQEARDRGRVALQDKSEQRAIASGAGATASAASGGAAFVTPVFDLAHYAAFREYGRAFADACNKQTLPDYGMSAYMPAVTSRAGVASQTEAGAVNETDPSFGYLSAGLITLAGQITVSQQLLDRAGPNFQFDKMLFDQLNRDHAPQVDKYVLTQALANATSASWAGNTGAFVLQVASGAGGFLGQVSKAQATIRKAAGTVLNPTHLFLDPARAAYIQAWSDAQGRKLVVEPKAGPFNATAAGGDGDLGIEGYSGFSLNGLPLFTDANIPAPGTGVDQAIIGDLSQVFVYEGPKVPRVVPQTLAQNLQVLVQLYSYLAVIVRYPAGIYSISGTGMGAITYTT